MLYTIVSGDYICSERKADSALNKALELCESLKPQLKGEYDEMKAGVLLNLGKYMWHCVYIGIYII